MGNECCAGVRNRLGFSHEKRVKSREHVEKLIRCSGNDKELSKSELKALWDNYDTDQSGDLDIEEIQELVEDVTTVIIKEIRTMNAFIDEGKDGAMEQMEKLKKQEKDFKALLHGMKRSGGIGSLEVFNAWDKNNDGGISFDEFEKAMTELFKKVINEQEPSRRLSTAAGLDDKFPGAPALNKFRTAPA